ncbi:MAG: GNAT family N-acetyltransferase [Aureispira sp.]
MNKWLHPIELARGKVKLEPLSLAHAKGIRHAVQDGALWQLWYTAAPAPQQVEPFITQALEELAQGQSLPFAVVNTQSQQVVGTTRLMHADAINKRIEIGHTWYAKSAQQTGINTLCKYLLLEYAFETLQCIAVEFRTHWHNLPSRTAIAKLGAKQDGVLRNHKLDKTGNLRDTVVFSIIDREWKTVKHSLEFKINKQY